MKKLILAFMIAISGVFVACNNHSEETTENDSVVTDTVEVVDTVTVDSLPCDSVQ